MIKSDLDAEERLAMSELFANSEGRTYSKNEVLVNLGTVCNDLYLIEKGIVRNYYYDDKGKDVTHWFSSEGMVVTSPPSFFGREPSIFGIQALEVSLVRAVSYHQFEDALKNSIGLERWSRKLAIEVMIALGKKVVALQTETAESRYLNLLTSHPDIFQRVNLGHIAGYLGITLQTLSKIRASNR